MIRRIAIALLLIAATAEIAERFPLRANRPFQWDFANAYAASRAWLGGESPYDMENVLHSWRSAGDQPWRMIPENWAAVHPPTTLVMIAPFALLPALPAMLTWFTLTLVLFVLELVTLVSITGWSWRNSRVWLFIAAIIASTPPQVALLSGQVVGPGVALIVVAIWCILRRQRELTGGVLLGIATALKIQIGAPFLLFYLILRPRPRVAVPALLIVLTVAAIGIVPMQLRHQPWLQQWMQQMHSTVVPGGVNDPTLGARYRFELLNVHVLLHGFIRNDNVVRLIGATIVAALLVPFVFAIRKSERAGRPNELLALAALSALTLLPVYHKEYDATVLAIAFVWAMSALGTRLDRAARLALIALFVFLIPADLIQFLRIRVPAIDRAATQWWFEALLVPHYAWAVLVLCALLTLTCWRERRASTAK